MKNKILLSLLIGAMALPLGMGAAMADHTVKETKSDPNDTRGRLDIVKVRYIGNGDDTATLVLKTAEAWRCRFLRGVAEAPHTYSAGLSWEINRDSDRANEKSGHFSCRNKKLFFTINNGEPIRAPRPDRHTARVRIPLKPTENLSIYAISRITGEVDGEVYVDEEDIAPEGRLTPYN
ncbi:MAG: hypothetical protein M3198_15060 [Actinomycetota bacterium]|nr:hypothetical protein [Actinomycetota bacterium]